MRCDDASSCGCGWESPPRMMDGVVCLWNNGWGWLPYHTHIIMTCFPFFFESYRTLCVGAGEVLHENKTAFWYFSPTILFSFQGLSFKRDWYCGVEVSLTMWLNILLFILFWAKIGPLWVLTYVYESWSSVMLRMDLMRWDWTECTIRSIQGTFSSRVR